MEVRDTLNDELQTPPPDDLWGDLGPIVRAARRERIRKLMERIRSDTKRLCEEVLAEYEAE